MEEGRSQGTPMKRRLGMVLITAQLLGSIFTRGWKSGGEHEVIECVEGLPPDAEFVRSGVYSEDTNVACLIFEHESFAPVEEGAPITQIDVQFHRTELARDGPATPETAL